MMKLLHRRETVFIQRLRTLDIDSHTLSACCHRCAPQGDPGSKAAGLRVQPKAVAMI